MSEALLLQGIAGYTVEAGTPTPQQLFASILLGRPFDEPDLAIRACTRWAVAEANRAVGTGRAGVDKADLLAFRMVYRALRAEAAAVSPGVVPPKTDAQWRRTLTALTFLRHRQRAALTLRYCFGLSEADTGWVIGMRDAGPILGPAVQRVLKALASPADVPRALRTVGRRLLPPPVKAEAPAKVARLPRKVVRDLIAPVMESSPEPITEPVAVPALEPVALEPVAPGPVALEAAPVEAPPAPKLTPVEVLIAEHPKPEPCIPGAPPREPNRAWSILGRIAAAAAVAALFVWAVWPAAR